MRKQEGGSKWDSFEQGGDIKKCICTNDNAASQPLVETRWKIEKNSLNSLS